MLRYRRRKAFYANRTIYDPWLSGKRKRAGNERRLSLVPRSSNTCRGDGQIQTSATAIFPSHSTGNTCRGNGRIQANVIALFPFRSTSYLMPRRRDRGEKQSDLTLPPHRRRLPRRRISLTSRRLSAAGIRKRTDKHALACKKRRSGKRANSCRKRRKRSAQTDKLTAFFERRQIKTATQTRKTAVATRRER